MEASHNQRTLRGEQTKARHELIVKRWRELGQPPVDAALLKDIQNKLSDRFGDAPEGPASIARVLADEDAELRHPEVIEFDARWREARIESETSRFGDVGQFTPGERLNLEKASELITKFEKLRLEFERNDDTAATKELRTLAVAARQNAESLARNAANSAVQFEQAEITEWLKVWLQTPNLFKDWLELRRRSEEFRLKFSALHHEDTKTQSG